MDEANSSRVRRKGKDDIVPHWSHDVLVTTFARKMGKLILVHGAYPSTTRIVTCDSAEYLSDPKITGLIRAIISGKICVDFDAFILESGVVRDHGTKFRFQPEALPSLYNERRRV